MPNLVDRVYGAGKPLSYGNMLGSYNKPNKTMGSYNKPVRRLGFYNGVGTMGKSNVMTELHK